MRRTVALLAVSLLGLLLIGGPTPASPAQSPGDPTNPPSPGFDLAGSDARAIDVADATMRAMGGRKAWDDTRYLRWKFFGMRLHVWDKWTGAYRLEYVEKDGTPVLVLMNLQKKSGRVWKNGEEITDGDTVAEMLHDAVSIWINDSYWIFMPYKLKDSGVTLGYEGERPMEDGRPADVLQLTFHDVGRTPQNKYDVYVAKDTRLVEQWSYYEKASDEEPGFTTPWADWKRYGQILLSDDRGQRKHTKVAVFDQLPPSVFEDPAAVDWSATHPLGPEPIKGSAAPRR